MRVPIPWAVAIVPPPVRAFVHRRHSGAAVCAQLLTAGARITSAVVGMGPPICCLGLSATLCIPICRARRPRCVPYRSCCCAAGWHIAHSGRGRWALSLRCIKKDHQDTDVVYAATDKSTFCEGLSDLDWLRASGYLCESHCTLHGTEVA